MSVVAQPAGLREVVYHEITSDLTSTVFAWRQIALVSVIGGSEVPFDANSRFLVELQIPKCTGGTSTNAFGIRYFNHVGFSPTRYIIGQHIGTESVPINISTLWTPVYFSGRSVFSHVELSFGNTPAARTISGGGPSLTYAQGSSFFRISKVTNP